MRKVFPVSVEVPEKQWVVEAALIYEKVYLNWLLWDILTRPDDDVKSIIKSGSGGPFLVEILARSNPVGFIEQFDEEVEAPQLRVDDLGGQYYFELQKARPDIDIHLPFSLTSNRPGVKWPVMNLPMMLPVKVEEVSISQLLDFRASNERRRAKFQTTVDALIKSFGEASSEEEAQRILRFVGEELGEQLTKLETIYRHTRIEATAKLIGTIGGPPALLGILGSVMGNAFVEAAGFVASASLAVIPWLIAREKADVAVNDSSWAYLWHMKKELG